MVSKRDTGDHAIREVLQPLNQWNVKVDVATKNKITNSPPQCIVIMDTVSNAIHLPETIVLNADVRWSRENL